MVEKKLILVEQLCKGCGYCIEFCPNKVLVKSSRVNDKGATLPSIEHPEKCIKCGLCAMLCPDFAMRLEEENENE